MTNNTSTEQNASSLIDGRVADLGDWRGETLSAVRRIIHVADPEVTEEWKWVKATNPGTPVWSHNGDICTGEIRSLIPRLSGARDDQDTGLVGSGLNSFGTDARKHVYAIYSGTVARIGQNIRRAVDKNEAGADQQFWLVDDIGMIELLPGAHHAGQRVVIGDADRGQPQAAGLMHVLLRM